jgi:tetratricopeptide (TPR) repeat protein
MKSAAQIMAAIVLATACGVAARATPYIPQDGAQVVERLPQRNDPQQQELRRLRAQLAARPQDAALAAQLAKRYIDIGRASGDPRYLGYAQAALAPWWTEPAPPPGVRILRAIFLQNQHRFDDALADLDGLIRQDRNNAQAWLTRATVLQVRGRFEEAKASCARLFALAPEIVTATCFAGIAGETGQAAQARALIERAIARDPHADAAVLVWAHTVAGETAARQGDAAGAERHFRRALALDRDDAYLLGAYADFLLDAQRPQEAVDLLKDRERVDSLLLRLAEAHKQTGSPDTERQVRMLQDRFAAAAMRGDTVHRREQARFALHLQDDARTALDLARQNWAVQKEPADVRILLEAAVAAHDRDAASAAVDWIRKTRLEDSALSVIAQHAGA